MTASCPPDRPLPAGWVEHPRVRLTRNALALAVGLTLIGIVGATASVWMRRTQLEKTTQWLGEDTIRAIQILPQVTLELSVPVGESTASGDSDTAVKQIDLSGMPGLGHLRHALLEQRHYDWQRETAGGVDSIAPAAIGDPTQQLASLTFSDPRGQYRSGTVRLELEGGWVESGDGQRRVPLIERARPAIKHSLTVLSNAHQAHHDRRLRQAE